MIKVAIIGLGHWGKNYYRIATNSPIVELIAVSDTNEHLREHFSDIAPFYSNYLGCFKHKDLDAIIIATPASTHKDITISALESGIHTLVEKPMSCSQSDSLIMLKQAQDSNKILMIGHTFVFNDHINIIKDILKNKSLQNIKYINSTRTHKGLVRYDVSCIWDLAIHDISISNHILQMYPLSVSATGDIKSNKKEIKKINTSHISLYYPQGIQINIHVSWEREIKERKFKIIGEDFDLTYQINEGKDKLSYNHEEIITKGSEPLENQFNHFIHSISTNTPPKTEAKYAISSISILEAIDKSILNNGNKVDIAYPHQCIEEIDEKIAI